MNMGWWKVFYKISIYKITKIQTLLNTNDEVFEQLLYNESLVRIINKNERLFGMWKMFPILLLGIKTSPDEAKINVAAVFHNLVSKLK